MQEIINSNSSIIFHDTLYEYNEICRNISICRHLIENTQKNGKFVIYADMSANVMFLILAILTTDNCYIPIDVTTPKDRVYKILEQTDADIIITEQQYSYIFDSDKIIIIENIDFESKLYDSKKQLILLEKE